MQISSMQKKNAVVTPLPTRYKSSGVASINFVGVPNIYKITLPAISNTPLTLDFALDEKNYSHSWVLVFDAFGR